MSRLDALRFTGPAPGPRLLFLGGVHGEERPGSAALERLAGELADGRVRLQRGTVELIPRVNAAAFERGVHQVEENLNRIVRRHEAPASHEQRLANALLPHLDAADAVLDLHGAPAPSVPFAFLDDESPENRAWAEDLGLPFLLTGWPALYAGAGTVTTTEYAQARGKRALTVEAGQNDDPAAVEAAYACALRTLAHFGLTAPVAPAGTPRLLRFTRMFTREREGAFAKDWKNFDAVKKGEPLARYADGEVLVSPADGVVVMPFAQANAGDEWLYLAEPDTTKDRM